MHKADLFALCSKHIIDFGYIIPKQKTLAGLIVSAAKVQLSTGRSQQVVCCSLPGLAATPRSG